MNGRIFYVGHDHEVLHHAAPLQVHLPVQVASPETVCQQIRPGDLAMFFSEHFDRFRTLCKQLKQQNIATLYAVDGILEWRNAWENRPDEIACPWTMRPCLADVVATIGWRQQAVLEAWGNRNCLPIGLPRLDELCTQHEAGVVDSPCDPPAGTARQSVDASAPPFRVLVMTAKCPGYTETQIETTYRSLQAVRDYFKSSVNTNPTLEVVWRLTGDLEQRLQVTNAGQAGDSRDLVSILKRCDAVITTPSTAMLEAMLLGLPVAILDFHNTPTYADAAYRIPHAEQIGPVVDRLVQHRNSSACQQMQEFLLQENLLCDGMATGRMVQLIQIMLQASQQAAATGQPLRLDVQAVAGKLDFRIASPQSLLWKMRLARISTAAENNKHSSVSDPLTLEQWQAYTEQLERENQRLLRLTTEAHQVFDHMQSHPVLGTFLKSHEWWSRLWQGKAGKLAKPESWTKPE